jgi:hypothetical protein
MSMRKERGLAEEGEWRHRAASRRKGKSHFESVIRVVAALLKHDTLARQGRTDGRSPSTLSAASRGDLLRTYIMSGTQTAGRSRAKRLLEALASSLNGDTLLCSNETRP